MQRIGTKLRRIVGPALLAAAELVVAFALLAATAPPAAAQFDFRFPFFDTRPRRPSQPSWPWGQPERREAPVDFSKAPPPRKHDTPPTTNIVVLGDSMADWLGYGLEEAFAEAPVFWVGLPAIRGTRSTADMVYLNDLYRSRAEKAGIVYVDVWDGFVDETGNFSAQGPDFEGQIRRLRAGDGVHFTKAGARKLAHYVEREIRRVMLARATPLAMPAPEEPQTPAAGARPGPGGPAPRPVAGPVVPLTSQPTSAEALLGGGPARGAGSDPLVNRVMVKGEAVPAPAGRADDFAWPRRDGTP